jgi:pimeloyl-ACP methyl ester carboxylesterase
VSASSLEERVPPIIKPITRKLFLAVLVCALLAAAVGLGFQEFSTAIEARKFPPPGKILEVNGKAMHLNCIGSGRPTVMLESGLLHGSMDWVLVQPSAAKFTRVCAYDRAGYGWSEYRSGPRTAAVISGELSALLTAAGEKPPFILVGHSLGGIMVRQFALQHSGEVIGMVFLDSSHEQQLAHVPPPGNSIERSEQFFHKQIVANMFGVPRLQHTCGADPLRADLASETIYLECRPSRWLTASEEIRIFASPPPMPSPGVFGNVPIEVLTRDVDLETDPAERAFAPTWIQLQKQLAALSTQAHWSIVKGSSHAIYADNPGAVVDAIRRVWESSQRESRDQISHGP